MYVKLFRQIFDSSIADDWEVRVVFEDFLILADSDGVVDMTPEAISARTRIPLEIITKAIKKLESPDPKSRTPDHDGRRIIRMDDHRTWGWLIVNYEAYRKIHYESERRGERAHTRKGYVYYILNGTRNRIKIGFSKNPWSRLGEMTVVDPGATIAATEKGFPGLDSERQRKFLHLRIDEEWFVFSKEIEVFLQELNPKKGCVVVDPVVSVATTPPSPSSYVLLKGDKSVREEGVGPTWSAVEKWLESAKLAGSDYTEPEAKRAWMELNANGWMWGKNPIVDWRSALECRIQDRRKSPAKEKNVTSVPELSAKETIELLNRKEAEYINSLKGSNP